MTTWRPQHYERQGKRNGADPAVVSNALAIAARIKRVDPRLPPIFTLNHLAHLSATPYQFLRNLVERKFDEPYRVFRIRKRPAHTGEQRFRTIAIPSEPLLRTQRWITQSVLAHAKPHSASMAFSKGDTICAAAELHCECAWLIKMDVRNFFESINEIAVYRVFRSLGYEPLVSFELARICTRRGRPSRLRDTPRWRVKSWLRPTIKAYQVYLASNHAAMGHLPQGAPTSPMLANLSMREFDASLEALARSAGLTYTRYADDLTFSTVDAAYGRTRCSAFIGSVYAEMAKAGLSPNITKTRITPPGSRKIVLGLLVNGPKPRLTREFRATMRRHLHHLHRADTGPVQHARTHGFASVIGFRNHLKGLATYARQIDRDYGEACLQSIESADWPL